ncbi:MAG: DUF368 domain-containing protein [Clostridia bacterium]|nr:DUF368 domain-containing protein [Clostridia bacterium]
MGHIFGSILDILRGAVIGLANVIPGVSGGTMMVAMGIYDKLISSITGIFKNFKKSIMTLLPYAIGMVLAIVIGSFALKAAFANFPLPTNALFIGLILGSLPMILKEMKGTKKGVPGIIAFIVLFVLVIVQNLLGASDSSSIQLSVLEVIKLLLLGVIASATMIIPGVSGSMMLKTLGYYEPIVTETIPQTIQGLTHGDMGAVLHGVGILLPFAIGIILGIYYVAKLIEWLLHNHKGVTYCGILGMVVASPVVTLWDADLYVNLSAGIIIASVVALAVGLVIAMKLGGDPEVEKTDAA